MANTNSGNFRSRQSKCNARFSRSTRRCLLGPGSCLCCLL